MNREKYTEYFNIIKDLYIKKDISIEWYRHHFRFHSKIDLNNHIKSQGDHLNPDEFEMIIAEIATIIRDIALGNRLDDYEDWKVSLVKENLVTDEELIHINILSTSSVETLKNVNQEIMTKRSEANINETIGYSLLLTLEGREKAANTVNFELSKKQLVKLIETLNESLSNIEKLEKKY